MGISRSENMSRIRGRDTGPEAVLRAALDEAGIGYTAQERTPVGRPDVVIGADRIAVFVDGCFWHGCPRHYVRPRSHSEFWAAKLAENVARDRAQTLELERLGWSVVRVWEHSVYEEIETVVAAISGASDGEDVGRPVDWRVVRVEELDPEARLERRHLEALRDPGRARHEEGRRVTAKWRRPRECAPVKGGSRDA